MAKQEGSLWNIRQVKPEQIEEMSFSIIGQELEQMGICLKSDEELIVKRAVHATADFDYAKNLVFSPGAAAVGIEALKKGAVVVTDTNMAKAGINKRKLEKTGGKIFCFMADEDVAAAAKKTGGTRASASIKKAAELFGSNTESPVILAVGNSPTALITLYELMKNKRFCPDLVIGVPVGFVNVEASKELILSQKEVPYIIAQGRKGGSNVAAAIVNAMLYQVDE